MRTYTSSPCVHLVALAEASDEAGERAQVEQPAPTAAAVALHDSGITQDHPYLDDIVLGPAASYRERRQHWTKTDTERRWQVLRLTRGWRWESRTG
jgi:hypothetical protein